MKYDDIMLFDAIRYNHIKKYWFCAVPTTVRRSGELKISNKRYNILKDKYNKHLIKNHEKDL